MDFLKPPTDNLYKFMTISGLILFLISVTYPPWLLHRTMLASYDAKRDYDILQLEIAEEAKKNKEFNAELDRQIKEHPAIENDLARLEVEVNKLSGRPGKGPLFSELDRIKTTLDENEKSSVS